MKQIIYLITLLLYTSSFAQEGFYRPQCSVDIVARPSLESEEYQLIESARFWIHPTSTEAECKDEAGMLLYEHLQKIQKTKDDADQLVRAVVTYKSTLLPASLNLTAIERKLNNSNK